MHKYIMYIKQKIPKRFCFLNIISIGDLEINEEIKLTSLIPNISTSRIASSYGTVFLKVKWI